MSSAAAALLAIAALCVAAGAAAQNADTARRDSTRTARDSAGQPLERVVVSATRPSAAVGGAGAVTLTPDSLRLAASPVLEDALREMPFVLVRQNSRGETELSVRGSDSRQTAVLLDGFPLTLGFDHRSDPSVIPLSGVRSIVLVRGLSSLLQGPNVLGGVLELGVNRVAAPPAERSLGLRTGFDQTGAQSYHATGALPARLGRGTLLLQGGAGYRDRPGMALSSDVLDPAARGERRTNSDVRQLDGFAAARYEGGGGRWVGLFAGGYEAERGVPPELHIGEPRLWRYPEARRFVAVASGGTGRFTTPAGRADAEVTVGVSDGYTEIHSFASTAYDEVVNTEVGDDRTLSARLLASHSLGRGTVRAAMTYAGVRYLETLGNGAPGRYEQRLWSAAAEAEHPVAGALRASAGLAVDGASTPESGDKPPLGDLSAWGARVGLSAPALGGAARLHASLSRRARFPALRELYSGSLGRFEPNPALDPEALVGAEAGITMVRASLQLQGVVFQHRLSDAIVRTTTEGGKFRRVNRDRITSTGVELLAGWTGRGGLTVTGDLLLQRVRVADPAVSDADRRPEHQPELRTGVDASIPLPLGLRGGAGVRVVGKQYCVNPDRERQETLGAQARGDAAIEREWRIGGGDAVRALDRVNVTLSLDNVTDAAVYDQCGLPQPGRTLRLVVSWR